MISAKKRFKVLSRDGFTCKYCGQKSPFVQLEVDHVIPKNEGGTDSMDNLVTSCFKCNRGKGGSTIEENKNETYKTKINDTSYKLKSYFYDEWNKFKMGTLTHKEKVLIAIFCDMSIKGVDGNKYYYYLDIPPLNPGVDINTVDKNKNEKKFKSGGVFCDKLLNVIVDEEKFNIDNIINFVYEDGYRDPNYPGSDEYSLRLNYKLTEILNDILEHKNYVLLKHTLFHDLVKNG